MRRRVPRFGKQIPVDTGGVLFHYRTGNACCLRRHRAAGQETQSAGCRGRCGHMDAGPCRAVNRPPPSSRLGAFACKAVAPQEVTFLRGACDSLITGDVPHGAAGVGAAPSCLKGQLRTELKSTVHQTALDNPELPPADDDARNGSMGRALPPVLPDVFRLQAGARPCLCRDGFGGQPQGLGNEGQQFRYLGGGRRVGQ